MRNRVTVIGDCALIQCNHKGELIDCAVDVADLERLELLGTDVNIMYNGHQGKHYARIRVNGKPTLLHRVLTNAKTGEMVSFHDGNGLNCRQSNLYKSDAITISRKNIVRNNRETGGTIGITYLADDNKYMARIRIGDERIYLGCYDTLDQAIQARRKAEQEDWGI